MSTSNTRIFAPGRQTHQTVGQSAGITIDSKFGIATTKNNSAAEYRIVNSKI